MEDKLLKILNTLKTDFEMLEDGSWDLTYSDGTEIQSSIDSIDEAIELIKTKK